MKALNRAIARTVSQIARHAGEGCHVPMIMALENHLDALLTLERKQLEVAGAYAGNMKTLQQQLAERCALLQLTANDNTQPAPDVIDMTDLRNWQVGDVVGCRDMLMTSFGKEFVVTEIEGEKLKLSDGKGYVFQFHIAEKYSAWLWLRHGEVQS